MLGLDEHRGELWDVGDRRELVITKIDIRDYSVLNDELCVRFTGDGPLSAETLHALAGELRIQMYDTIHTDW